jgi:histidine triad (HIT) family protein
MSACLFCQICNGDIPANIVYQDDLLIAFDDIHPQAPLHQLIIPREHIGTLNDIQSAHDALVGRMLRVAAGLAEDNAIAEKGYRVVMNCNAEGGQEVYHIHLHLLGGKQMQWPPG